MRTARFLKINCLSALAAAVLLAGALQVNAADTVEVTVKAKPGFKFEPATLEVPAGAEVVLKFENAGIMAHNITVPELGVATPTISAGESETIKFTVGEKGTYKYICSVPGHAQAGMTGQITVR